MKIGIALLISIRNVRPIFDEIVLFWARFDLILTCMINICLSFNKSRDICWWRSGGGFDDGVDVKGSTVFVVLPVK